ncbi:MAG: hypothetical protein ACRD5G_06925, partial [Candidatus Acidiferrales bacterium]
IFLAGTRSLIVSVCGHRINCFEHHFFHMAGILVDGIEELSMPSERPTILATTAGFGHYQIIEGGARGRHLRSAYETLISPDEVWEGNPKFKKAKWGYIKEYKTKESKNKSRPFSLALVGDLEHPRSLILVPYSSFAVRGRDVNKKWRQGTKIYP